MLLLYFIKILKLFHAYTPRQCKYEGLITQLTNIVLPQ